MLGLIATRSISTPVPGIEDLVTVARQRIEDGLVAYNTLLAVKQNPRDKDLRATLDAHVADLGYALLLKSVRPDIENATPAQINEAANSTIPNVPVLFWSFRFMVGFGLWFIALFATAFWFSATRQFDRHRWFLRAALLSLPLPWLAAELGWVVAEYGRQPWVIEGVLPTALGVSSTGAGNVLFSLLGFALFYTLLLVADLYLLVKYIRIGPDEAQSSAPAVLDAARGATP